MVTTEIEWATRPIFEHFPAIWLAQKFITWPFSIPHGPLLFFRGLKWRFYCFKWQFRHWKRHSGGEPLDYHHHPLTIYPWKLPPRKIAFQMICCLHNCPWDKWPWGKLSSRKIVPRINYTQDIFFPRIRNWSTLTDSCFLFSFFVV